ncbi:hypothetical protein [Chitinophaga niabensis]|uniref:Uncharacterized protein n=1 Tax=Chitinophaga niabensis TaxID=536979 RepID=A0A1N6E4N4_9BACT|nr:hypothetical protein [Chitinophaga niabensis]SIN77933.1 hypothetical protein SAMN04488055_1297 [Chitinophaga niabensis]
METEKTPWDELPYLAIKGTDYQIDIRAGKLWALTTGVDDVYLADLEKMESGCYMGYFDICEECFVKFHNIAEIDYAEIYAVVLPPDKEPDYPTYVKMKGISAVDLEDIPVKTFFDVYTVPFSGMAIMGSYHDHKTGHAISWHKPSIRIPLAPDASGNVKDHKQQESKEMKKAQKVRNRKKLG